MRFLLREFVRRDAPGEVFETIDVNRNEANRTPARRPGLRWPSRWKPDERAVPWLAFSAIFALVSARAPVLLTEPRFWAEEGNLHFVYARSHDWLHSLLFVPIGGWPAGYFNLVPNLAMLLSTRLVDVESAPLVSTLVALAVQVVPFAVVLWGRSFLWSTQPQRFLACLLLALAPCVVGGVWMNTINSQIFLGLAALLILCEKLESVSRRRRIAYRGLLALAGLTGVYTVALAPVAVLRAYWQRGREERIQALLIVSIAVFQAVIYLLVEVVFGPERRRFDVTNWGRTAAFAAYHGIIRPVVGDDLGTRLSAAIGLQAALGDPELWRPPRYFAEMPYATWALVLSLLVAAGLLVFLGWPRHLGQKVLLAALFSLWLIIVSSTAPAVPRGRYTVLPGLVVVLAIYQGALQRRRPSRWIARLLVAVCLLAGIQEYPRAVPPGAFGELDNRPDWQEDVARWRSQPLHHLRIWPYNETGGWWLRLRPRGQDFAETVELITGDAVQLVAKRKVVEHEFAVQGIPDDFKIVLVFDTTRGSSDIGLRLRLLDAHGVEVESFPIQDLDAGHRHRVFFQESRLRSPLQPPLPPVRRLVVSLRSPVRSPVRVRIHQLTISPELDSLLERAWDSIARSHSPG